MKMIEIVRPGHFMREDLQRKYQRFFPTWKNQAPLVEAEQKAKSERYKTYNRKYKKVRPDAV